MYRDQRKGSLCAGSGTAVKPESLAPKSDQQFHLEPQKNQTTKVGPNKNSLEAEVINIHFPITPVKPHLFLVISRGFNLITTWVQAKN